MVIRWTGLAPWEFESPFPGSLTSICVVGCPSTGDAPPGDEGWAVDQPSAYHDLLGDQPCVYHDLLATDLACLDLLATEHEYPRHDLYVPYSRSVLRQGRAGQSISHPIFLRRSTTTRGTTYMCHTHGLSFDRGGLGSRPTVRLSRSSCDGARLLEARPFFFFITLKPRVE